MEPSGTSGAFSRDFVRRVVLNAPMVFKATPSRDFTVAVFVVWQGRVLLHLHRKLGLWLPPGGHIEENELPDEAAVREVLEEAGVRVTLVGDVPFTHAQSSPVMLVRPRGVQLEDISEGHQHVDLVYFARPEAGYDGSLESEGTPFGWYAGDELVGLGVNEEITNWCRLAFAELP